MVDHNKPQSMNCRVKTSKSDSASKGESASGFSWQSERTKHRNVFKLNKKPLSHRSKMGGGGVPTLSGALVDQQDKRQTADAQLSEILAEMNPEIPELNKPGNRDDFKTDMTLTSVSNAGPVTNFRTKRKSAQMLTSFSGNPRGSKSGDDENVTTKRDDVTADTLHVAPSCGGGDDDEVDDALLDIMCELKQTLTQQNELSARKSAQKPRRKVAQSAKSAQQHDGRLDKSISKQLDFGRIAKLQSEETQSTLTESTGWLFTLP